MNTGLPQRGSSFFPGCQGLLRPKSEILTLLMDGVDEEAAQLHVPVHHAPRVAVLQSRDQLAERASGPASVRQPWASR